MHFDVWHITTSKWIFAHYSAKLYFLTLDESLRDDYLDKFCKQVDNLFLSFEKNSP